MGFFKKHFGHSDSREGAPGAESSAAGLSGSRPTNTSEKKTEYQEYAPPPGPPPSKQRQQHDYRADESENYAPPPGPPPSHQRPGASGETREDYRPPSGPPPSWQPGSSKGNDDWAPPPGPPPSHGQRQEQPPAYEHDWQSAVPDTSLLPPPPAATNDFSPTSNASESNARAAWDWCKTYPLREPMHPQQDLVWASNAGSLNLSPPSRSYKGKLTEISNGTWSAATRPGSGDQCFLTSIPMYFALAEDSPKLSGQPKTVYFEVHFNWQGSVDREGNEPSLAIGFAAFPYPTWRMPGWERGSVAVHSDDGRRYVNNQDGGLDFVEPFKQDTVLGFGLQYWREGWGSGPTGGLKGQAFFTRNGQLEGKWQLQEEMDQQTGEYGIFGIAGDHDLFGAIGTFGEVAFKAVFRPEQWAYRPGKDLQ